MGVETQQRTHTVKLDGKALACEHARIFGDADPMNGLFQDKRARERLEPRKAKIKMRHLYFLKINQGTAPLAAFSRHHLTGKAIPFVVDS